MMYTVQVVFVKRPKRRTHDMFSYHVLAESWNDAEKRLAAYLAETTPSRKVLRMNSAPLSSGIGLCFSGSCPT